jgi:hypothetical protein
MQAVKCPRMTTRYAIAPFGAMRPGPAETSALWGTVTTTAAHRGLGSPFAVAKSAGESGQPGDRRSRHGHSVGPPWG